MSCLRISLFVIVFLVETIGLVKAIRKKSEFVVSESIGSGEQDKVL